MRYQERQVSISGHGLFGKAASFIDVAEYSVESDLMDASEHTVDNSAVLCLAERLHVSNEAQLSAEEIDILYLPGLICDKLCIPTKKVRVLYVRLIRFENGD